MRAIVHDESDEIGLRLEDDVAEPVAGPGQAVVEVAHVALNFGEIVFAARDFAPGDVIGHDAAGTVVTAAPDGSGPAVGTRVVGFARAGAWAQRFAVDTADLAPVDADVDLAAAAARPAAGVTALRAVRDLGPLDGRRVLVTGASGGVGRFAVQLAARAGAEVFALVGGPGRGEGLAELGAAAVVTSLDEIDGLLDGVLENVGGELLAAAFAKLGTGGRVLSIGMASKQPTVIDFEAERLRRRRRSIEVFTISDAGSGLGAEIAELVELLRTGRLDPQIGWHGDWSEIRWAARMLIDREIRGKVVLDVS